MKHSEGKDRDMEGFMIYFDLSYLIRDEALRPNFSLKDTRLLTNRFHIC